ncbi:MAG: hypothetical protein JXR77_09825 [Lentisphaeria bacterium]|nr:hypothetical protein [Lentisphaeria bacterium]
MGNATRAIQFPADFFPILPWGRGPDATSAADPVQGLPSMAECGFTLAGFVAADLLPLCEQNGLRAIVHPGGAGIPRDQWSTLPADRIEARIRAMIETIGDSPALLGYYLVDEPGATKFPGLGVAVATVRRFAPGKLAYINLFPGYATIGAPDKSQLEAASFTEYLERYVAEVRPQFISYDDYMVQYSQDMRDPRRAAVYFNDLLEVRRVALKHGLPFWNICSSNQIRPFTTIPSPANLLFQAYTTLAAGGRGLSWYRYYVGGYDYAPIDKAGRRTPTWGYLRLVNRQVRVLGPAMHGLTSTGVFFTAPPPLPDLPLLPGSVLREVYSAVSGQDGARAEDGRRSPDSPPVMVGEFVDAHGGAYAMVVNLTMETSARILPVTVQDHSLEQASAENGEWLPVDREKGIWLVAGQGVLLRAR